MDEPTEHRIEVHLDELVAARDMTLVELSAKVGVTVANLSILKNGHARAVRFTTLTAICDALSCSPGELLSLREEPTSGPPSADEA
jgi:putative transcriptional regulator